MRETRELWDAWSDAFQARWNADTAEGDHPPAPIHLGPGCTETDRERLLPDPEGMAVVELGCGGGQASVGFARAGADRVVGVDLSTEQLRHARALRDGYGVDVRFLAGDLTALALASDAFDLAHSSWVLQMVADLETAFAEAARVLRPGGTLVLAVPHPFYRLFDSETGDLERRYGDPTPERRSVDGLEPALTLHRHTVAELHAALTAAGFAVDRLVEPSHTDPDAYRDRPGHDPELMATVPPTPAVRASV